MRHLMFALLSAGLCLGGAVPDAAAEPRHAIAMHGEPALPADFSHFSYANPDAPKGGNITYCVVGSFDNLNPFIIRSLRTTARGVIDTNFGNKVFEIADAAQSRDEAFSLYGLLAESIDIYAGPQSRRIQAQSARKMVGRQTGDAGRRDLHL